MNIELRAITKQNWQAVVALKLKEDQQDFVFENSYSLAESFYCEHAVVKAIYFQNQPAGFLMYESLDDEGKPNEVEFLRFMIDAQFQKQGIGKRAFELALLEIEEAKNPKSIHICFTKENKAAAALYTGFGFEDNGLDEYGQINLVLKL